MPKRSALSMPVQHCPDCGEMLVPPHALGGDTGRLWKAEHDAKHLDWMARPRGGVKPWITDRLDAWRTYAHLLEEARRADRRRHLEQVDDLEARIEQLEYDNHLLSTREVGT